jgi:hypothetical protein
MAEATGTGSTRAALVAAEGVAVSEADAVRIETSVASAKAALIAAIPGSMFDTEPGHFDRFLISEAFRGQP